MATTTLSTGITTTSMFNTPQATDDTFCITEDVAQTSLSGTVYLIDVMLNDLGRVDELTQV